MKFEKDSINLILLNAGRAVHHADWNWENINSPYFRIYYVEDGSATLSFSGKEYALRPGHLYLVPPFTLHSDICNSHFILYYLHICEEQVQNISLFEQISLPVEVEAFPLDSILIKRLVAINPDKELSIYDPKTYDNSTNFYKQIAENSHLSFPIAAETNGIIWQLFSRFLMKSTKIILTKDSRILTTLHFIREHIDKKITIRQLSSLCFLSDDHFIRLFKHEMNVTPVDYINRKKVELAQLMLVMNNRTIKDIACSLSFDNCSYFNRVFKNLIGKTPTEYRKGFK